MIWEKDNYGLERDTCHVRDFRINVTTFARDIARQKNEFDELSIRYYSFIIMSVIFYLNTLSDAVAKVKPYEKP